MTIATALPLLALFVAVGTRESWRSRIRGAILWAVVLVALTEGLAALALLTPTYVAIGWLVVLAGFVLDVRHRGYRFQRPELPSSVVSWSTAAVVLLVGLIAVTSTPNTWDSMTYHLPRVMHWAQQGDLSAFAAHTDRQLFNPPFAEFAILHLLLLSGGDAFVALPQFMAWLGCAAVAAAFAQHLTGGSRRAGLAALVFVGTAPMAILQASSTQNDLIVAFFVTAATALTGSLDLDEGPGLEDVAAIGAAAGLALLTKGTGYLFIAPIGLWLATRLIKAKGAALAATPLVVATVCVLAVNAPHWGRNQHVYGNPLGPDSTDIHMNQQFGIGPTVSNLIRNAASQVGFPSSAVNATLVRRPVVAVHRALGLDADDPATSWEPFRAPLNVNHEDHAPGPIHLALALSAAALALSGSRMPGERSVAVILLAQSAAFAALLVWQPWQNRLTLPLLLGAAPLVGAHLGRARPSWTRAASTLLLAASPLWVFFNRSRPLVGPAGPLTASASVVTADARSELFANRPGVAAGYEAASNVVRASDCSDVGMVLGGDDWEYPWWRLLNPTGRGPTRLENVLVDGPTAGLAGDEACAIVWAADDPPRILRLAGRTFTRTEHAGRVAAYLPAGE